MSKYENNLNYNANDTSPILNGEKVIWQGKPKKSAFIINKALTMAPLAILWLLIDSFFIISFVKFSFDDKMLFFIIPFFAIHLMPVWIWIANVLTANRKWKNTKYYITDKRIIIQDGFIAENYQTIYYKEIKNVRLHVGVIDKFLGVGDIYFDINNHYNISNGSNNVHANFLDIENYQQVYQMAQKVVLDIQTDIEYPNALRPNSNPGYNTEYNPIDNK